MELETKTTIYWPVGLVINAIDCKESQRSLVDSHPGYNICEKSKGICSVSGS